MARNPLLPSLLLPFLALSAPAAAAGQRWNLDVEPGTLRPLSLQDPAQEGAVRLYWYLPVRITNNTGAAQELNLGGRLLTRVRRTPEVMPVLAPEAQESIRRAVGRDVVNVLTARGTLESGASLDAVVVFAAVPPEANHLEVRLSGLASVLHRVGRQAWVEVREYSVSFRRLGDEHTLARQPLRALGHDWVVVSRTPVR